jgi:hypothetical protein
MQLPCIIIRPLAAFKAVGVFFKQSDFEANSFQLEDIFLPKSVETFRNASLFSVTVVDSIKYGKLYMVSTSENFFFRR